MRLTFDAVGLENYPQAASLTGQRIPGERTGVYLSQMGSPGANASLFQVACVLINLIAACGIVFTNKLVFSYCKFQFTVALTCIHTVATLLVAKCLRKVGLISPKPLPRRSVVALASAFAGYIVLCNASLSINTVGFYQLLKIAGAPTMMMMDAINVHRFPNSRLASCVILTCVGIGLATVSDTQVTTNAPGVIVGIASVIVTSQYGIWIGSMSKSHDVTSMQLLDQYLPYAAGLMSLCVAMSELAKHVFASVGHSTPRILEYEFNVTNLSLIAISALMGVLVTFTTFAVIGFTSPLTYAVVGHIKTIVIFCGGVFFFHDSVTPTKAVGIMLAMIGVVAYTCADFSMRSSAKKLMQI
jgi:solute carrier family 35 protein E3